MADIGEHAVGEHTDAGCNEDVIDALGRVGSGREVLKGAGGTVGGGSGEQACVFQQAVGQQGGDGYVAGGGIEIACADNGGVTGYAFDAGEQQTG